MPPWLLAPRPGCWLAAPPLCPLFAPPFSIASFAAAAYVVAMVWLRLMWGALGLETFVPILENKATKPVVGLYGMFGLKYMAFWAFGLFWTRVVMSHFEIRISSGCARLADRECTGIVPGVNAAGEEEHWETEFLSLSKLENLHGEVSPDG